MWKSNIVAHKKESSLNKFEECFIKFELKNAFVKLKNETYETLIKECQAIGIKFVIVLFLRKIKCAFEAIL